MANTFTPGQSFTDAMKATGVKSYGTGRWPQWRTWHIGAPGTSNFRFGNYEYIAPNDTSRDFNKGKATGSNLNRALYRYATLKNQFPSLSDDDAWNQSVDWIIKNDLGGDPTRTGFKAIAAGSAPPPNTYVPPPAAPPAAPGTPGGPPASTPPASPNNPPAAPGGTPPVSAPLPPFLNSPGAPPTVAPFDPTAVGNSGNPWTPVDTKNYNFGPALAYAFKLAGYNAGADNPYFEMMNQDMSPMARFADVFRSGAGAGSDPLGTARNFTQQALTKGAGSPLDYNTFQQMVQALGQRGSSMESAVMGERDAQTGFFTKDLSKQYSDLMGMLSSASYAMNPQLANAMADSVKYLYQQYTRQSAADVSGNKNFLEYAAARSPMLAKLMGR